MWQQKLNGLRFKLCLEISLLLYIFFIYFQQSLQQILTFFSCYICTWTNRFATRSIIRKYVLFLVFKQDCLCSLLNWPWYVYKYFRKKNHFWWCFILDFYVLVIYICLYHYKLTEHLSSSYIWNTYIFKEKALDIWHFSDCRHRSWVQPCIWKQWSYHSCMFNKCCS